MSTKTENFIVSAFVIALAFVALFFAVNSYAVDTKKDGATFSLTQEEADQCTKGGGCILISEETAAALIEYMQKLEKASKDSCKFKTI